MQLEIVPSSITPDNTQYDKGTVEGAGVYIIDDALINSLFHVHFTHT